MGLENGLLIADVMHARQNPKPNVFNYGVYYVCFALKDMQCLKNPVLSLNRFNLFGFYDRDHAKRDGSPVEPWIRAILAQWNIPQASGQIVLLTMPRILGHVFNPVSFWFCFDEQGNLRAVLSEVCNTFKERHCYLSFHDDRRPITKEDWLRANKVFHVSPFMDVSGYYLFRFFYEQDKIGVWINYYDSEELMLSTSVVGQRKNLNASSLIWSFLRYPFVTLKVVGLIHYQAFVLLIKGVRYRSKPLPPETEIST